MPPNKHYYQEGTGSVRFGSFWTFRKFTASVRFGFKQQETHRNTYFNLPTRVGTDRTVRKILQWTKHRNILPMLMAILTLMIILITVRIILMVTHNDIHTEWTEVCGEDTSARA